MALFDYKKFKVIIATDSKKSPGFKFGDVVRREYYDGPELIYSLMVVLETGVDVIAGSDSYYFVGALVEGSEPVAGQLLDFVRITSLYDENRAGAMYLTASDSDAPYMDVIDGMGTERSLAFPLGLTDTPEPGNGAKCGLELIGKTDFNFALETYDGIKRWFWVRPTDYSCINATQKWGIRQGIRYCPEHPSKLLISFRAKASSKFKETLLTFGYADDSVIEAEKTITFGPDYEFYLFVVTVDYPSQYDRYFSIILSKTFPQINTRLEIDGLNIVQLSDVSALSTGTKVRVGKVKGIVDPIFGSLEGYGAYFQNLYATKNVNIAGTLTAGDENGFASTFYVGKIHKNVVINSLSGIFKEEITVIDNDKSPSGIGDVWKMPSLCDLTIQSLEWKNDHIGQWYCFSMWFRAASSGWIDIRVDDYLSEIVILEEGWKRYTFPFYITESKRNLPFRITIFSGGTVHASSPQLEAGKTASQYQPTDGTLSYVEDYGAWFNKGGIGGTIQNPLLRLNEDGSISSRDGSFVINPDGTGQMASGRFRWTGSEIILQDFTIKWEDLSTEAQDNLKAKSVALSGTSVFHYPDELLPACEPATIHVFAAENNFTASTRKWYYQGADTLWHEIPNGVKDYLEVLPGGHYWEGRKVLPIKYVAIIGEESYEDVFTITKQYDGSDSYAVYIDSDNGNTFRNGVISTTLSARVLKGGEDVTDLIPEANFRWIRTSSDALADQAWNEATPRNKTIEITGNDVFCKAVFDCEVTISIT